MHAELGPLHRLLIRSEFLLVVESGGAADHLLYAGAKWPLVKEERASERSSPFRDGVAGLIEYDSTWATKKTPTDWLLLLAPSMVTVDRPRREPTAQNIFYLVRSLALCLTVRTRCNRTAESGHT